jgi:hypothetical protein
LPCPICDDIARKVSRSTCTASDSGSIQFLARPKIEGNAGRVSQFQLFSTLLVLAGYDRDAVRKRYGAGLFDEIEGERVFLSGFFPGTSDVVRSEVPEWTGVGSPVDGYEER